MAERPNIKKKETHHGDITITGICILVAALFVFAAIATNRKSIRFRPYVRSIKTTRQNSRRCLLEFATSNKPPTHELQTSHLPRRTRHRRLARGPHRRQTDIASEDSVCGSLVADRLGDLLRVDQALAC
jgi:hypothetical protein